MKRIKWYNVPRGAKCYMNTEEGEQTLECLGVDGKYLKWKTEDGKIAIGQLDEYGIDETDTSIVYEILDLNK